VLKQLWRTLVPVTGVAAVILLFAGTLPADIIFLDDGRVIEGDIVSETADEIAIKTPAGALIKLEPWQVTRVAKKEEIQKEYDKKKLDIDQKDPKDHFELAAWCRKHGLKNAYEKELRLTIELDPKHPEARKALDLIEGKIELPDKPRKLSPQERQKLREKALARKKEREEKKKAKKEKKNGNKYCPFGTVTKDKRIPGDLDCKGDCRRLVQGGYMKFDLKGYKKGTTIKSASLKVYVKNTEKNPWLWVCQIPLDPVKAPVKDVHAAIQSHKILISGAQKVQPGGWRTIRLSRKAVQEINKVLAKDKERWFALALTFE